MSKTRLMLFPAVVAGLGVLLSPLTMARQADISTTPLSSVRSAQVKPNIMLLMDTSGSMAYSHMPDEVETTMKPGSVGYKNFQCNSLYYNPGTVYDLPRKSDGTFFSPADFTQVRYDAFDTASTATVDLRTNFRAYETGLETGTANPARKTVYDNTWPVDGAGPATTSGLVAYYYTYSVSNSLTSSSSACAVTASGAATQTVPNGGGTWTRVLVNGTSGPTGRADERQNFANWYAYYRTRMLLTKTTVSLSFNPLNDSYRVGLISVQPNFNSTSYPQVNPDKFLAVNDFSPGAGNQRDLWYSKLFAQKPGGSSPAREGLARVGRYYANKFDGINQGMGGVDPIQYSCQKNFTIMTTDGYWNAQNETTSASLGGGYLGGPVQIDGKSLVADSRSARNPDGTLTTDPAGNTPFGVYDGSGDSMVTVTDRQDTFASSLCSVGDAPFVNTRQTVSSTQSFTSTAKTRTQTKQQYTSASANYTTEVKRFTTSTNQVKRDTQQYGTQTLTYTLATAQTTKTTTPFTTKVTTLYKTSTAYNLETTSTVQESSKGWTRRDQTSYTTGKTQWYAATTQQNLTTSQYKLKQEQKLAQKYQTIRRDGNTETSTVVDTCTPGTNIICEKRIISSFTPVADCNPSSTGSPNYVVTECRTDTKRAEAPIATCSPGTSQDSNFVTSVCTNTVLSGPSPSTCTTGTSQDSATFITSTCAQTVVSASAPVDTSTSACTSGNSGSPNYYQKTCTVGPMAVATGPSAPCTAGTTSSGAPNFVNTVCTVSGPTTSYVSSTTACNSQTATSGNSGISLVCTPGAVVAARNVASCTPRTTGTGASAVDYTCSAPTTTSENVQNCTKGYGTNVTPSPEFKTYVCTAKSTAPAASAACTAGSDTPTSPNWVTTTCTVNGPTTTYVATAASCVAKSTASSSNGGEVTTCNTPPPSTADAASCSSGVTGTGSSQATITCGTRPLTSEPVASCTVGSSTSGAGVVTTCGLAVGTRVPVATCVPGDTAGTGPNYVGSRCSSVTTTSFTSGNNYASTSNCSPTKTSGNSYTASTCTVVNQTAEAPVSSCTAGTTYGGSSAFVNTTCTVTQVSAVAPLNGTCTAGAVFDSGTGNTTICAVSAPAASPVASCAPGTTTLTSAPYTRTTCTDINSTYSVDPIAACANQAKTAGNQQVSLTCNAPVSTTTPTGPCTVGTTNTGTVATTCAASVATPEVPANCAVGVTYDSTSNVTTTCTAKVMAGTSPATCTAAPATAANNWTATTCTTGSATGSKLVYGEKQTITKTRYAGGVAVETFNPNVSQVIADGTDAEGGMCHFPGVNPLVIPPAGRPATNPSTIIAGCTQTSWPCTDTRATDNGSYNSLADVAQYYYSTDLRPEYPNTGKEAVAATASGPLDDRVTSQHMTTFTIALGVSGTLEYDPAYRSSTTGDFSKIVSGVKSWPQWPSPLLDYTDCSSGKPCFTLWEDPRSIDDFWHTAVNGRGQYFSAKDPKAVASGVAGALSQIDATLSSGAAAGTSTLEPVVGDNLVFFGSYTTQAWTGDVLASQINLQTGDVNTAILWSAQAKLDAKVKPSCDNRTIYLIRPGSTTTLVNFSWNTFVCGTDGLPISGSSTTALNTAEQANFSRTKVLTLSHAPQMTDGTSGSVDQPTAAADATLVNFLRGQKANEGFQSGDPAKFYRKRVHTLGDVIGGQPVYVKAPFGSYQDTGYAAFKSANSTRTPMVYVAANDGMLHAFYAGNYSETVTSDPLGGQEAWAVIPSTVLPNLYKLADNNYENVHQYYVDGTPVIGDVRDKATSTWKSILVGGLNAGGKGYYALDVTNPASPAALWEFKFSTTCYSAGAPATAGGDCNLGLTFGKPVITKVLDPAYPEGRWVVMVSSGYNNVNSAANDGHGFLYVIDAITGQLIQKLDTGAGDSATPSNLGQLNAYVDDSSVNNTALRVYGGDMSGNVWRFDVNNTQDPAGREATLVGQAKIGTVPQPITTRPELAELNGKPMVLVATGRLLGTTDVTATATQSIYGIVDQLTGSPVYADLRGSLKPMILTQTGVDDSRARTVACSTLAADAARCASDKGWFIDLPDSGERVNVDMKLALNTLVAASNVPDLSACSTGGYSWLNYIDYATGTSNGSFGGTVATGTASATGNGAQVSQYVTGSLIVGVGVIRLPNGRFKTLVRTSGSEGTPPITGFLEKDLFPSTPAPAGKRISWREVVQ